MIQIDVMVMGSPDRTMRFEDKDKAAAKQEYLKYRDTISCYAQVSVDGKELTLAEALKFFRLPAIMRHTPRETAQDSNLPHFKRRRL